MLSVEYKLYSHILNESLNEIIHKNNLIPLAQNGFTKDRGSDQCIHTLLQIINDSIQKKRSLYCLFIDFAKAFNSVEHWVLEDIFKHINLGDLGDVILRTLLNLSTKIETAHGYTDNITFKRGTKQGDIISPTLFIIFLAPLLWLLKSKKLGYTLLGSIIEALAVTDDIALIAENLLNIMALFNWTFKYSECTDIKIKPSKSASAYRSPTPFIPKVNNIPFENLGATKSYKYLGVMINLSLNWEDQREVSENTFKNTLFLITNKFYLSCKQHIKLVNAVAIASLRYRMQFFHYSNHWLEDLFDWTIKILSRTHHISSFFNIPVYWTVYKNLISLKNLNIATYISNLHKNLNKTNLITYPILNTYIGPYLNGFPGPSPINTEISLALKNLKIDIVSLPLIQHLKHVIPPHITNNELLLTPISSVYHIHLSPSLFRASQPPINIRLGLNNTLVALIGTDGSVKNGNMGSAISSDLINNTLSFPVSGPLNSAEPEIQGIEQILIILALVTHIYIFTDSLVAINLIKNFHKFNTNQQLKTVNRTAIRRIVSLLRLQNRSILDKLYLPPSLPPCNSPTLTLYHIHSHMLENKQKALKHLDTHTANLKHLTNHAIQLNHIADHHASLITENYESPPPTLLTIGNDVWQLMDRNSDTPIYKNLFKVLYSKANLADIAILKNANWEFTKRLFHPQVSAKLTTRLLRLDGPQYSTLSDFMHRLIDKSLPTRKKMQFSKLSTKFTNKLHPIKRKKFEEKYAEEHCVYCFVNYNTKIAEDTQHIFSTCKHHEQLNRNLRNDIIKTLEKFAPMTKVNCFPLWFTCDLPSYSSSDVENELTAFPKTLGDSGYIPKNIKHWLKAFIPKKNLTPATTEIIFLCQANCHNKWKNRCQFLHDNYKHV